MSANRSSQESRFGQRLSLLLTRTGGVCEKGEKLQQHHNTALLEFYFCCIFLFVCLFVCLLFRKVLQIIPESMFGVLHQIIGILTNEMREVPTRLEKEKMKEFAQLDARYRVRNIFYKHYITIAPTGVVNYTPTNSMHVCYCRLPN